MRTIFFALAVILLAPFAHAESGLINPNLATEDELAASGLVSAELAAAIADNRPYLSAVEFDTVLGKSLSADQRAALYGEVFRPFNLNTASRTEIMLIPGLSERMAHEFEEYRPYSSMEQFRREIGKYVDDDEVARLERYVFVPVDLNAATEDEIMDIPGMSKRMAHEFEEYRPYKDIEQFRREIGKYVDEEEVARLESYITLD